MSHGRASDVEDERGGRRYPERPIVAVAGVVLGKDRVLLIRRGRNPMYGQWSLPGGGQKLGETLAEAVKREIFEETGVAVSPVEQITTLDRLVRDGEGRVQYHYVLVEWLCEPAQQDGAPSAPTPKAASDAQDATWVDVEQLFQSNEPHLDDLTLAVIRRAVDLARGRSA